MDTFYLEQHHWAGNSVLLIIGTGLLALLGLIPTNWLNRRPKLTAKLASVLASMNLIIAGVALVSCLNGRASYFNWNGVTVYFDALAALVYLLVSLLLLIVMRFSRAYLAGDPQQGRYFKWLSLTGAVVLLLVVSGNLLQFTLCWMAVSLCLHQLLVFYRHRPGALLAARKKFIISRLGDMCLISALVLVMRDYGTWDIPAIFAQIEAAQAASPAVHSSGIALLLVLGALLKSAQFPFHSWLPDTMETPTPVSAFMHAGIINAGGFLILRFNPLIAEATLANHLLVLVGGFTALFGAFVMLTQASIKRALAFSTVSQMGFMMLECGLGAYGMALLHLIAHSLYKAHAFLRSGSAVGLRFTALPVLRSPAADMVLASACLPVALFIFVTMASVVAPIEKGAESFVLLSIMVIGISFLLWSLWRQELNFTTVITGLLAGSAFAVIYQLLHTVFGGLVYALPKGDGVLSWELAILLVVMFVGGYLLCVSLFLNFPGRALHQLYIHARNGFYINTLANRLTQHFWPVKF